MNTNWNDKKVLITGGTSGLGQSLGRILRQYGAHVACVARHAPRDQDTATFIQGDVSDKNQIHRIHAEALTRLGSIDVLINNASTLGPTPLRLLLDTECEDLTQVLETNVLGPFRLIKLVLPGLILKNSGLVVNISSDAAVSAYPHWGAYGVSKAALDHLTRIFQAELAETAVRFLALDPGDMDTPLHLAAVPGANRDSLHQPDESALVILDQIASGVFEPLRRNIYETRNTR